MLPALEWGLFFLRGMFQTISCILVLFSYKLIPAERNYDIGNRELLAIHLALEEWQQWLEGTKGPFLILTDHKFLECLHSA